MDAMRGFITSGVEAASCLLLQDHFAWNQDSIGFCIGLTFCLVVPGYLLHRQYQARCSDIAWIRIYTAIAMLATTLLGGRPVWMSWIGEWDSKRWDPFTVHFSLSCPISFPCPSHRRGEASKDGMEGGREDGREWLLTHFIRSSTNPFS